MKRDIVQYPSIRKEPKLLRIHAKRTRDPPLENLATTILNSIGEVVSTDC